MRLTRAVLAAATLVVLVRPLSAGASLTTTGFRAVAVAHAPYPISAVAVAPDGRLFAAIQARAQTAATDPGTAEIRVYRTYTATDGSILDEGRLWATVEGVRATSVDEGLLGIAISPDFDSSKLVYVYLATTDESVNQHVRVYRENASGTGDLVGDVATSLEPPTESTTRSGGGLRFGVDGCLYVGVGDNGSNNRWNAQLLSGTDPIQGSETNSLCTNVCLGPASYPNRTVTNDGLPNHAGKVLRMNTAAGAGQPVSGAPFAQEPLGFATGFRNPLALAVHPLTGQIYATERGDTLEAEVDLVDSSGDFGWPCLDGTMLAATAGCLGGQSPATVYGNHPGWRRPLLTHTGNPALTGIAAYTGLGYPADYYGDVFYLMRDSDRIYRIDLQPPCFLPHPNGVTPVAFHDSTTDDNDFSVFYDFDGDGTFETLNFPVLTSLVQSADPLGRQVLYVAGKQGNGNGFTEQSVIFRIEFAGALTPYSGPTGRVADSCFTSGTYSGGGSGAAPYAYENPFQRPTCIVASSVCTGRADGASCDDGDPCNGPDTCNGGSCQHGPPGANGTVCGGAASCHDPGTCQAGVCVLGAELPDGSACSEGDPCTTADSCSNGVCQAGGGPSPLNVRTIVIHPAQAAGSVVVTGTLQTAHPLAPKTGDVMLELSDAAGVLFSGTLATDSPWKSPRSGSFRFRSRQAPLSSVTFKSRKGGKVDFDVRAARAKVGLPSSGALTTRLVVGDQCFSVAFAGRCRDNGRLVRCGR